MAATLTIGGVNYSAFLEKESLVHVDDLTSNPDTLAFNLIANSSGVLCPKPPAGAEVIYTLADGTRLFGGELGKPEQIKAGVRAVGYVCNCTDYRTWLDAKTLNDRFVNVTPGQVLVALCAKYAPWVDTSHVDLGGQVIATIRFKPPERLTDALERLRQLTGYVWDMTPHKELLWYRPGAVAAPFGLYDGSHNFNELHVATSTEKIVNRVIVKGAKYPASTATVDPLQGDGTTTSFRLTQQPYGTDQYLVMAEDFGSLKTATWQVTSPANPTPPAGHIAGDGYLFTTIQAGVQLEESGKLQVVGGTGTAGDVRLQGITPLARGLQKPDGSYDGFRRFEIDVFVDVLAGQGRAGLWDPAQLGTLAGEAWSVFYDNGTLKPSVGGVVKTALATVTVTAGHSYRIRIVPKAAAGALIQVNTDDTNGFLASSWVDLYDDSTATGTAILANYALTPIFNKDQVCRVGRVKVFNRLYGIALEMPIGTPRTVGLADVDLDGGLDAVVGTEAGGAWALSWFPDTTPAAGAPGLGRISYYRAIPLKVQADDPDSQKAMKALRNTDGVDGVIEGYINDETLDTLQLARARAAQELIYADPEVTITFYTYTPGLKAGQVLDIDLTLAASGRDLVTKAAIQEVTATSLGDGVQHVYQVTAGSRLKGADELLIELLLAGKKPDAQEDDNAPLDVFNAASDTFVFTDSFSIAPGPVGPYLYAEDLTCEDGRGITLETGVCLEVESSPANPARYGMSCYV